MISDILAKRPFFNEFELHDHFSEILETSPAPLPSSPTHSCTHNQLLARRLFGSVLSVHNVAATTRRDPGTLHHQPHHGHQTHLRSAHSEAMFPHSATNALVDPGRPADRSEAEGMMSRPLAGGLIDFARHHATRQRLKQAIALLGPVRGRRILEIRCRRGLNLTQLAARGAREVVGVDSVDKEIGLARSAAVQQGVAERCQFTCAELLHADLSGTFDACLAIGHFAHLPDPAAHLRRMAELTNGDLIVSFPERYTLRTLPRLMHHRMHGRRLRLFTLRELHRMAQAAGLDEIRIHRVCGDLLLHARSWGGGTRASGELQNRAAPDGGQLESRHGSRIKCTNDDPRSSLNDGIHAG